MQTGSTLLATGVGAAAVLRIFVEPVVELGATTNKKAVRTIESIGGFLQ